VQIQRYRSRLSGPLLDRIDVYVEVPPVRLEDIERAAPGEFGCHQKAGAHGSSSESITIYKVWKQQF